jgi:hypothetical protein
MFKKLIAPIVICLLLYSPFSFSNESILYFKQSNVIWANDSSSIISKAFKKGYSQTEIISIPKGNRPLPSKYLKSKYIRRHIRQFKRGVAFLIPAENLDKYGRSILGRADGQFVMSKKAMNDLIFKAHGEITYIEHELGIPSGSWSNYKIIRIDIPRPRKLHLRLPSGNEIGANELWIPGGKLPNGYSESVIDPIPKGKYKESVIEKK